MIIAATLHVASLAHFFCKEKKARELLGMLQIAGPRVS
jgi:hypothetical protein